MSARTLRLVAALAAALAASGASAFVRTTSSQGACFYWQERSVPFRINATRDFSSLSCGEPGQTADAAAIRAVREGFRTWTGAVQTCTDLQLADDGLSDSRNVGFDRTNGTANENLVVFRAGWCSEVAPKGLDDPCWDVDPFASGAIGEACANKYNCFEDASPGDRATIAITTVTHNPESGRIVDADIEFADWTGGLGPLGSTLPPEGWYFTCTDDTSTQCSSYGQDGCAYIDLQSNATHEVGHFIGLAHPCDIGDSDCIPTSSPYRSAVMFPSARLRDISKRVLTTDDRAGVCAIYPLGGPTATCGSQKSDGGGCASGGAGGILSALLALGALGRITRRTPRA